MKSNKELKQEYKEMKPVMGVFQIRNSVNNKILVDGHHNVYARWNRHQAQLNFDSHQNTRLQKEWNTYGPDKFVFEVVLELKYEENKTDYQSDIKKLLELVLEEVKPTSENSYH